jgi:hypothetical protein
MGIAWCLPVNDGQFDCLRMLLDPIIAAKNYESNILLCMKHFQKYNNVLQRFLVKL